MRKNRTSGGGRRLLRQCAAIFLGAAALWLVWLTADLSGLGRWLSAALAESGLAEAAVRTELGVPAGEGLPFWDRLVLAQATLLDRLPAPGGEPEPIETDGPEPVPTGGGEEPEPTASQQPGNIIGKTMVAGSSAKYITWENIAIYNHTDYTVDIEQLLANAPKLDLTGEGPQVLIFHSHATEAYTPEGDDVYEESDRYRTVDIEHNIVRVGTEMTAILEAAGIEVIHDTTLFDYPNYNDGYIRSSAAVEQWLKEYPSIQLVIDLHRDALETADGSTIYKTVAGTVDNCAQVMMVMGTDAMGQTHPNWRVNLALAVELQNALCAKWATLARPIVLRPSRFNQHQSTGEILLEIGTHGNTLQEAITAGRLFARTIVELTT